MLNNDYKIFFNSSGEKFIKLLENRIETYKNKMFLSKDRDEMFSFQQRAIETQSILSDIKNNIKRLESKS